MEVIESEL